MVGSKAVIPGSFNPITLGHYDLIKRSLSLFGHIDVVVAQNDRKPSEFLSLDDRAAIIKEIFADEPRVSVAVWGGVIVDYIKREGISIIVRGARSALDFQYEEQLSHMNQALSPSVETILLFSSSAHYFVTSTVVRELVSYGKSLEGFVPPQTIRFLEKKGLLKGQA